MAQGERLVKAPSPLQTPRLVLSRPESGDAREIFERYASDEAVCRYLAWPRHATLEDTRDFIRFSDAAWRDAAAGPYLLRLADGGEVVGSTGLEIESPELASTGYVIARDSWGRGYASECLRAMIDLSATLGIRRLTSLVHPDHLASQRVLEKGGFEREGIVPRAIEFPNLSPGKRFAAYRYAIEPRAGSA